MSQKLRTTIGVKETLKIKRIRYKCPECGKTHTFKLEGLSRGHIISDFVKTSIKNEFYEIQSFRTIAKRYDISIQKVINIFDEYTHFVPRHPLPEYLCIDEKHFEGDTEGKYCVVISDFFTGEIIDVLENRQMPYLDKSLADKPYFSRKENYEYKTWHMMERCLKLNMDFWNAYSCLQDFYEYWRCKTFDQATLWLDKVIKQLKNTCNNDLIRVANTYEKWKAEIANAITVKNFDGRRYSNGPAEGLNNAIKTIVKDANGYRNFQRFRKRCLLMYRYNK